MKKVSAASYRSLLDDATQLIYNISDTPRIDAEILMQHVIERPLAWLLSYGDAIADNDHVQHFLKLIAERQTGKPIAYIIGSRDFWTLSLRVNEHVLIPRPDTETLVEHALDALKGISSPTILDLGTGSGAIALSLAKELPSASVLAIDAHQAALNVAIENAERHALNNVEFLLSDWFTELLCKKNGQRFDLIASNPPYVESGDKHLDQGDLRFEPTSALVAKNDGLSDIKNIIQNSVQFINTNGYVIVEHGYNQQDAVRQLFEQNNYHNIICHHDINQLPRCTIGQYSEGQHSE